MAISTDERREVAAKLRKLAGVKWLDTFPHWEEAVMESWHSIRQLLDSRHINPDEDHEEICNRLADLIEPEPERTCEMVLCDTGEWFTPECLEEYLFCSNCKFVGYYVRPLGCCEEHEPGDPWGLVDEGQAEAGL